jgi:hypothetical protein
MGHRRRGRVDGCVSDGSLGSSDGSLRSSAVLESYGCCRSSVGLYGHSQTGVVGLTESTWWCRSCTFVRADADMQTANMDRGRIPAT